MSYIERDVTLNIDGKTAKFDDMVYIFKGDRDIQLNIKIIDTKMKFSRTNISGNVLTPLPKGCYARVGLVKPKGGDPVIRDRVAIEDDKVKFLIDSTVCDELDEVGIHKIQIQIYALDDDASPRWTLPSAAELEVCKPDVDFDGITPIVGLAKAGLSMTISEGDTTIVDFNEDGTYNKTTWSSGDVISTEKLNKIENVLDHNVNKTREHDTQIKDKANKDEVVKKGYANLNDFDEESRLAIAGGDFNLNYVLGEDNVKTKNIADNQVTPNKTNFINIEIGVNKFNKYNATIGGYLNGSGVVVGESDLTYGYSEKIAVNGGDIIRFDRYSALVSFPGVYYVGEVAYNINTISDLTYSNGYWCCTLPSNANFVRINIKSSYIDTQMLTINQEMPLSYVPFSKTQTIDDSIKIPNSYEIRIESLENKSNANSNDSNILYNKKWAVCGDSISYGARADLDDSGIRKTYDYYIAKRNNMTIVKNAISGSTITNVSGKNSFSVDRYKNLGSDLDYITLWFGINDSGVGSSILGTISDSDNTTFYGAWNVVLDYLIRTYPTAKIGIVVTYGGSETFRNATRDIAKKWGIPIFDIMGDFSIPLFAGRESDVQTAISTFRKEQFLSDGIHPNDVGYQYLSTSFESWLRSL